MDPHQSDQSPTNFRDLFPLSENYSCGIQHREETVDAYLTERMSETERMAFEEHLFYCDTCAEDLHFKEKLAKVLSFKKDEESLKGKKKVSELLESIKPSEDSPKKISPLPPKTDSFKYLYQFAAMFAVLASSLYGLLWFLSQSSLSPTFELANVNSYESQILDLSTNTRIVNPDSAMNENLKRGTQALLSAPVNTLGLFPRYERFQVLQAINHLIPAYETSNSEFVRAEIAFYIAKAFLMLEDLPQSKQWLQISLAQNVTLKRKEAQGLLQALNQLVEP